jgi:hypothetical protein
MVDMTSLSNFCGREARQADKEGFFFVKKKQKTFIHHGFGRLRRHSPKEQSFFASFCSQKDV